VRDGDVRTALHRLLRDEHAHELDRTQFVDELGLCGEVRVDVAVINGELAGYELKSERDTLRRLPTQVAVYSRVLDRAILVVAERHLESACHLIPPWWGLLIARADDDPVPSLQWAQRPAANPGIDPDSLVQLLWRDEALAELTCRGLDTGVRSQPRRVLWARLAERVPLPELRATVRARLKARAAWTTGS
jgi:hypothetical protein